ncbi:hypothetical protein CBP23_22795 [Fischerella thermalis WC344]|nr:hypothetical protein CBP23_22795 [Fischerella thermalis WC344]
MVPAARSAPGCNLNKSLLGIETSAIDQTEGFAGCNLNKSLLGIETFFGLRSDRAFLVVAT